MFGPKLVTKFTTKEGECIEIVLQAPLDENEAGKLFAGWLNDAETCQYLGTTAGNTVNTELEWFKKVSSDKECVFWMIYIDGKLIGDVDLHRINFIDRHAELGLVIGDKLFWGKGIATAIEVTILDYAFENVVGGGLNKIIADIFTGNKPSKRAIEKIGFESVGVSKEEIWRNGKWHDIWIGEMLASEWREKREKAIEAARIIEVDLYPGLTK